jgi:hypothetical protein
VMVQDYVGTSLLANSALEDSRASSLLHVCKYIQHQIARV